MRAAHPPPTDRGIDEFGCELVHELCGLTKKEIAVVEEASNRDR
ncbi:MAG: hypothetical protein ACYS9X_08735 [Planctomycetota bacterium]|jgi:hypothetical protein